MLSQIYGLTNTPRISFDSLKGTGNAVSGVTFDYVFMSTHLNVENLILYHTEDKNIEHRQELYLEEGKVYYDGNLFVPDDLDVIEL